MRRLLIIGFVLLGFSAVSQTSMRQDTISFPADTALQVLKLEDFVGLVIANHPIVKQGNLQELYADAELLIARGAFDPKLTTDWDIKNFDDKEYYNIFNSALKIPTWFPVDPKLSLDRNTGVFLGDEIQIPDEDENRQIGAGLSLPLGKGLFIDERRMAVRQAQAFRGIAQAEQVKVINKILLTAIKDYWDWYLSYQEILLLQQSIDIADELFQRVLLDYSYGEAAVVDTVQAKITYQTRYAEYEQVRLDYLQAGLSLAVHLWSENLEPLELQDNVIPDTLASFGTIPTDSTLLSLMSWAMENHPEILKLQGKIQQLEVENQWNRESLKPTVDLSYTFLNAPLDPFADFQTPEWNDNYKFGLDFYFPIFLRKERGKLQKTQLKIQENELSVSQARQVIKNTVRSSFYQIQVSSRLTTQYQAIAENYRRLLEAEILNLETGESDLFKLNIQQDKYIESQLKFFKTAAKFQKSKAQILYDAGLPFLNLSQ